MSKKFSPVSLPVILLCGLALFLSACSSFDNTVPPAATPEAQKVNVFGTAANHVHAMLALPNNVLVVATHYGAVYAW
ncbi:hypothetical protein KDW_12440 [Dictyobacter vulcani]|uniref:Uncharacterized protein n=1 Tax=Dictyobacter vulcani TaxID=2607529 RepID=A0A5J4KJD8_9CHLR|nr:hypothetical protein [Dictyobacter vulcani]GER87082.1 hypothetical protein KDW_12440 [Dictyobacter vulcani]